MAQDEVIFLYVPFCLGNLLDDASSVGVGGRQVINDGSGHGPVEVQSHNLPVRTEEKHDQPQ
jgi:hypothetical protein